MNPFDDVPLSPALLDNLAICQRCGGIYLALGWSMGRHEAWHDEVEKLAREEARAA